MKRKIALIAVVVLAVVLGARWWMNRSNDKPKFQTVRVERGDVRVSILATGVVQPQNRVEIKPPIAGRAEDILVREGEAIRKGQVLALMSSTERAALLDAARAKGTEELAHWEDLYKPTPLIAPLSGVIILRNIEPGQTVTAQDPVLVMSNRLIVNAQVDETDIGRIRVGQKTEITLDAYPQNNIAAQVNHIAYEAITVNNITIYEVDVVPARVPDFMRSGMTANVNFIAAEKKDVLILPAGAVQTHADRSLVMVPGVTEKTPHRTKVETGLSDGKSVEITSGLAEGDPVLMKAFNLPGENTQSRDNPFSPWGRRGGRSR